MKLLFLQYPKCSTCVKAKKWLEQNGIEFIDRHIVDANPSSEELKEWAIKGSVPVKKFFNTSGQIYKNENIKDKLATLSEEEQFALLGERGMLVKRPLVIGNDFVLVGFKEKEWEEKLK